MKPQERYELFAREYVVDLNGKRAAIAAGYAPHSAEVTASQLLTKVKVRRRVEDLLAKRASKLGLKAERVVEEIRRIADANMLDFLSRQEDGTYVLDLAKVSRDQAAAIQEVRIDEYAGGSGDGQRRQVVRTTFKLASKEKALDMLMRHLGAYNDSVEVTGLEGLAERLAKSREAVAQ